MGHAESLFEQGYIRSVSQLVAHSLTAADDCVRAIGENQTALNRLLVKLEHSLKIVDILSLMEIWLLKLTLARRKRLDTVPFRKGSFSTSCSETSSDIFPQSRMPQRLLLSALRGSNVPKENGVRVKKTCLRKCSVCDQVIENLGDPVEFHKKDQYVRQGICHTFS
uniref:Uncharacterized protein n=1 Tax=Kalanchoe fedtschenkoi TaxID=63787 RepID=A0A7N0UVM6_KALFE